jgi:hypothetical protein
MKFPHLNPYYRAALVLVIAAGVLLAVAILTDRRDITSAALVISSVICLITGIFLATLSSGEPLDIRYVSLLAVQGSINQSRICADLGVLGNAHFLPKGPGGRTETMQYIPVADYHNTPLSGDSFVTGTETSGLLTPPSGAPLLREIREHEHLQVPSDMPALLDLVREIGEDVLEVADKVTADAKGTTITVSFENFRLFPGCVAISAESPKCCTTHPCPVCSLVACVLAEGLQTTLFLERCSTDPEVRSVTAVYSLLP